VWRRRQRLRLWNAQPKYRNGQRDAFPVIGVMFLSGDVSRGKTRHPVLHPSPTHHMHKLIVPAPGAEPQCIHNIPPTTPTGTFVVGCHMYHVVV